MRRVPSPEKSEVVLREVKSSDCDWLLELRNDPRTRSFFGDGEALRLDDHRAFVANHLMRANDDLWFVIECGGEPVGTVSLYDRDAGTGTAEWGRFVVHPELRGRGIGGRALVALIARAREEGIGCLRCDVLADNSAAIGLYEKLHFRRTGSIVRRGRLFERMELQLRRSA